MILRRLLSMVFFGAALGLTVYTALVIGGVAYKALTHNNKKDKNFDYNSYGYPQYADKNDAFALS